MDQYLDENTMFYGALPSVFEKARYLRENPTATENLLWNKLRNKQLGYKFRRQHPIYKYIVDFYCHTCKLVIELDGEYHLRQEQIEDDKIREEDLVAF